MKGYRYGPTLPAAQRTSHAQELTARVNELTELLEAERARNRELARAATQLVKEQATTRQQKATITRLKNLTTELRTQNRNLQTRVRDDHAKIRKHMLRTEAERLETHRIIEALATVTSQRDKARAEAQTLRHLFARIVHDAQETP